MYIVIIIHDDTALLHKWIFLGLLISFLADRGMHMCEFVVKNSIIQPTQYYLSNRKNRKTG